LNIFSKSQNGQLGDGTVGQSSVPVSILENGNIMKVTAGKDFSLILKKTGVVYSFGRNDVNLFD
jgi:alpha-tubulin suppressor-like RCC1 family protein